MATARKCDRCGDYYDANTKYEIPSYLDTRYVNGISTLVSVNFNRIAIWLEPYYMIQTRDIYDTDCSRWRNLRLTSKEEYIEWNKKEKM